MKRLVVAVTLLAITMPAALSVSEAQTPKQKKTGKNTRPRKRRPNPAFAKVIDDPKLPRVLIIGDSISIGYTRDVQKNLAGKANVHRIPVNGGPTTQGLARIERWLGNGHWDVIHFNWGLHDLKYINGRKNVPLKMYGQNLRLLVKRMKRTKARLVWCATTPVPSGVTPPRKNSEVLEYNAVAAKIMTENKIPTDNLYTFAKPQLEKVQRPHNVHFTSAGSKILASQVTKSILAALKN